MKLNGINTEQFVNCKSFSPSSIVSLTMNNLMLKGFGLLVSILLEFVEKIFYSQKV